MVIATPVRFNRESRVLRAATLTPAALLTVAAISLTNIIAFGLWYWQFDRGGPVARAHAHKTLPDFQFVQMQNPDLAPPDWEPGFVDYFYLSFTAG